MRRLAIGAAAAGLAVTVALAIAWYASPFPVHKLDRWPASPMVTDRTGHTLLTLVGDDDQWRFPVPLDRVSPWVIHATIAVEDERFYSHHGVDPLAIGRAIGQNVAAMRTVSGASTLTMQVCRMMEDRPRSLRAKTVEAFRALQLERVRSKDQILAVYLNIAPYSGNVRGVEAAAQTWFGKRAIDLSLGEAALLAGLPQAPSRLRPDRCPGAATVRRNHVLDRMLQLGMITGDEAEQARSASLPPSVHVRGKAMEAPHAAWLALQRRPGGGRTTIDPTIQAEVGRLATDYASGFPEGIQLAVVVIDIASSDVLAMVGSVDPRQPAAGQVNGALGRRSPGSTLKPFVYAAAFEAGLLNDETIVYDVPIERAGWAPANFNRRYVGELTAADALRRSLNVPAILVAEATGLQRCLGLIESAGIRLPGNVQARGGLAVVTGATEVTLLDLTGGYATLGRAGLHLMPRLFLDEGFEPSRAIQPDVCAAINDILSSRRRRPVLMRDRDEREVPWFMWKTGTSSGRRDAWAVGHNHRYAVGAWVGRFSGAGSSRLIGAEAAEPLLASLFDRPMLRNMTDPPAPVRRPVTHPLGRPAELADMLQILSPAAGSTLIALGGRTTVHVRANRSEGLTWFLNGSLLAATDRLTLPAGRYELRCTDPTGQAAAACFDIIAPRPRDSQAVMVPLADAR